MMALMVYLRKHLRRETAVQYWRSYDKISIQSDQIGCLYDETPIFPVIETSIARRFGPYSFQCQRVMRSEEMR